MHAEFYIDGYHSTDEQQMMQGGKFMFKKRVNKVYDQKSPNGADIGKQIGRIAGIAVVVILAIYLLGGSV